MSDENEVRIYTAHWMLWSVRTGRTSVHPLWFKGC